MSKILLPVKGSRHDVKAGEIAGLLAQELTDTVVVMHVKGAEALPPENGERISKIQEHLENLHGVECSSLFVLPLPDAAGAIIAEAQKGYDYVILGAREDSVGETRIVGNTSRFVFQGSPCPVVLVKDVERKK
jgi:nucleotide-binding universal stress UspA family protein